MAEDLGLGITLSLKDKLSKDAGRAASSLGNVTKGAEASVRSTNRLKDALGPVGGAARSTASEFKRLALQFVGFAAIAKLGRAVFDTNVEFERLSGALKVATGSQEAGIEKFKELEKFASTTPYALEESVQGFITLKNLGLDPSERSLRSFGNTAASMGKPLQQMIEAVADASTMEFERLKEFGIKTKQEGNKVKFTFQGVTTTVAKDSKAIQEYLVGIGETKFAGAMEEQMGRLPGVISNFGDSLNTFFRKMGTAGFTKGIKALIESLGFGTQGTDDLAEALGKLIGEGLEKLAFWIRKVREGLGDFTKSVGGVENALRLTATAATLLLGVMAVSKIYNMISSFMSLASAVRSVGIMAVFADGAIAAIPALVVAVAAALGIAAGFAIKHWESIKEAFMEAADKVVKPWFDVFSALFQYIKEGFLDTAGMAQGLMNPLTMPGTIKDVLSGKAFAKSDAARNKLGQSAQALTSRGIMGSMPGLDFWNSFRNNKSLKADASTDWFELKKKIGLGDMLTPPSIPADPSSSKGDKGMAGLASLKNPGIGGAPIKIENKVTIPKTTITPAPVNIDRKKLAEVVFEIMQTQAVRN